MLATALLATFGVLSAAQIASAETRTLKLYYLHTREKAEITFKKDGKYIPSGLKQLNQFLRDWRRNEPTKMDPRLFDAVWEVYRATGARDYINVVSAYRSPATNSMLRKRSRGVAEKSQHTMGKAMDFFIPGVKLRDIRYAGLRAGAGGVGFYPTSGSPFVHLDVGNVRHWPKMSRNELASVFPKGNTMHVPADGKPLPGYDVALAAYQKRKGGPIAMASAETSKKSSGGFFARIFGGGADEEEETSVAFAEAAPRRAARSTPAPTVAAAPVPRAAVVRDGPVDMAGSGRARQESEPVEAAPEADKPVETIIAALPLRDVPRPMFAPRPSQDVGIRTEQPVEVAQVDPVPKNIPFEIKPDVPETQQVAVVENVPIPMRRPAHEASVAQIAQAVQPPIENAMTARGTSSRGEQAIESIIAADSATRVGSGVPVPVSRPAGDPVVVAALTPDRKSMTDAAGASKSDRVSLAGATKPASPRDALRGTSPDPVAIINAGPSTTPKASKPSATDLRPEPKPVSKPVQTASVDRAIASRKSISAKPNGEKFAVRTLHTAPSEVYTAGFRQGGSMPDAKRFSGKAVTFMPVAKFETN